ncbi:hypothetical protein LTR78_009688 [Recurvomyces mirabilis]|uniref:Uncharacterized protein n=1 Tax=Recurvomyces mirabilis TaxID=574656 RepID=A0AAE0WHA5_9PEZI|nr:hypothetical protein LTR78_009688 [Recurvomyces mirabilis]KAK5150270.1 hypothetical protein LTS14_010246 [Recurvomyces mirabilis]
MTALMLTIGVELEFLIVCPYELLDEDECEYDGILPIQGIVYEKLRDAGVRASFEGYANPSSVKTKDDAYGCWQIDIDDSLKLSDVERKAVPQGWASYGMELSSRTFSLKDDDWQGEINTVLECLQSLQQIDCRVLTNESTGLHVHAGFGDEKTPLRTAKNVCSLVTAFSHCLDELHHIS